MATLQTSKYFSCSSSSFSSSSSSSSSHRGITRAVIHMPELRKSSLPLILNVPRQISLQDMELSRRTLSLPLMPTAEKETKSSEAIAVEKMYALLEAISDRVEMHENIGEQRNNWNSLLFTSINAITLFASIMAGIAASSVVPSASSVALKLSSAVLYLGATGMLTIMNKIQPCQLAEEQRNAVRLFKQLRSQVQTKIEIGKPTTDDVNETMEKVLALDRAYPLPLLGTMLEKFPIKIEPAVWWPQQRQRRARGPTGKNGWDRELETEMREVIRVLEVKDKADYLRLGEKALKLNKALALAGPVLTGLGALGSAFIGPASSWAALLGVAAGAMAAIVNTLEHGGQVGMVFEMYRSNAGFFKLMQESIGSNLRERETERRENGELLEMRVALNLGRSLSELKELAASSSREGADIEEFASKLF